MGGLVVRKNKEVWYQLQIAISWYFFMDCFGGWWNKVVVNQQQQQQQHHHHHHHHRKSQEPLDSTASPSPVRSACETAEVPFTKGIVRAVSYVAFNT